MHYININLDQRCSICGKKGACAAGGTSDENDRALRTRGGVCLSCATKRIRGIDPRPRRPGVGSTSTDEHGRTRTDTDMDGGLNS